MVGKSIVVHIIHRFPFPNDVGSIHLDSTKIPIMAMSFIQQRILIYSTPYTHKYRHFRRKTESIPESQIAQSAYCTSLCRCPNEVSEKDIWLVANSFARWYMIQRVTSKHLQYHHYQIVRQSQRENPGEQRNVRINSTKMERRD